jgi:hypothetical protein
MVLLLGRSFCFNNKLPVIYYVCKIFSDETSCNMLYVYKRNGVSSCYELITDNCALRVPIDDVVCERETRREECTKEYIPPMTY